MVSLLLQQKIDHYKDPFVSTADASDIGLIYLSEVEQYTDTAQCSLNVKGPWRRG